MSSELLRVSQPGLALAADAADLDVGRVDGGAGGLRLGRFLLVLVRRPERDVELEPAAGTRGDCRDLVRMRPGHRYAVARARPVAARRGHGPGPAARQREAAAGHAGERGELARVAAHPN